MPVHRAILKTRAEAQDASMCDVYERREDQIHCGPDGYLLHFGLRNCQNFNSNETRSRFSPVGQKFIDCTTKCLVARLNDMFKEEAPNCSTVTTEAFDSHVDCYLQCDFCKVCKTEKVALAHTYYLKDFFSMAALRQVGAVIAHCGVWNCIW